MIVLGLLAGAWWALFAAELFDARRYRLDAAGLSGPDWDVRAEAASSLISSPAPYARALRQAKGVGRRRSQDLTRYFQVYGADAPPDGVRGIGATTAAAVLGVLQALEGSHSQPDDAEVSDPP